MTRIIKKTKKTKFSTAPKRITENKEVMRLLEAKKQTKLGQSVKTEKSRSVSRKSHSPRKGVEGASKKQSPRKKIKENDIEFSIPVAVKNVNKNSNGPIKIIFAPMGLSEILDYNMPKLKDDEKSRQASRSISKSKTPRSRSASKNTGKKNTKADISDFEEIDDIVKSEAKKNQDTKYARKSIGNKL
jgi:hypothetical protein